jgi:hypothetical protein
MVYQESNTFVNLGRTFSELPQDASVDDSYEFSPASHRGATLGWDDLLRGYRSIILAEAGTGKTEE